MVSDALAALAEANRPEQFTIMETATSLLAASPAVTHLMIRGSFAAGTSDRLSDVDLVVGIREADYGDFVAACDALVASELGQILPGWPDTIVPDFGGLGYVHLIQHAQMLYQLDLYLAPSCRIEEITTRTRGRLLYAAPTTPAPAEPASAAVAFIAERRQAAPTAEQLVVELLVLAWMIRKRIVRAQRFMAYQEAHQFTTAARDLVRTALSPKTTYLGWYHLEEAVGATPIGRSCLRLLGDLAQKPPIPTAASLPDMLDLALDLARQAAPEVVADLQISIDTYRHYLDGPAHLSPRRAAPRGTVRACT